MTPATKSDKFASGKMEKRPMRLVVASLMIAVLVVSACSREPRKFRKFVSNEGPEEFAILPVKPLQTPENLSVLPTPTPGGRNLTDPTPKSDAVVALGGNSARLNSTGVPSADVALVSQASRYGVPAGIREIVAREDREFRQRKSIFNWKLFPNDEYRKAYRRQLLDQRAELERFRRAGVRTPTAPPPN